MKKLFFLFLVCASSALAVGPAPFSFLKGVIGGGGGGGFNQIQSVTYNSSADATSHSISYSSTPTSGNLLVIGVVSGGTIASPPSGWTLAESSSPDSVGLYCYYKIAGSSEPSTVSFTQSAAAMMCITALEFSGMVSSGVKDQSAHNATVGGSASTVSTGTTATTGTATDLLIVVAGAPGDQAANNDGLVSFSSWSAGYTTVTTMKSTGTGAFGSVCGSVGTRSVSATGAYSATATWNTTTGNPEALIVAFKKT